MSDNPLEALFGAITGKLEERIKEQQHRQHLEERMEAVGYTKDQVLLYKLCMHTCWHIADAKDFLNALGNFADKFDMLEPAVALERCTLMQLRVAEQIAKVSADIGEDASQGVFKSTIPEAVECTRGNYQRAKELLERTQAKHAFAQEVARG